MPWIDTSQPVVCLAFVGQDGAHNATLDLFPSRVTWHGAPDDLVGALAVAMLQSGGTTRWNRHAWGDLGRVTVTHPLATLHPYALHLHDGDPLPMAGVWRTDGATVVAPDGQTWPCDVFCGGHDLGWKPNHGAKLLPFFDTSTASTTGPLVRGALLALQGAPASVHVPALARFVAAQAPTPKGKRASAAAVDKARSHATDMANLALANGFVQGNRSYAPSHLDVAKERFPQETPEGQIWHQAGFDAARCALDSGVPAWLLDTHHGGRRDGLSAHTALRVAQAVDDVRASFLRSIASRGR